MTQSTDRFRWETMSGEPIIVDDVVVTPQSQALTVRWPPHGGFVWNRPVAVLVRRGEDEERIPIVDVTRVAQIALYGLSVVFGVVGLVKWVRGRSGSHG